MIVIDTNVISEMMRSSPNPAVLSWVAGAGHLHTTAITLAEIEYGIARLPTGRRQDLLSKAATEVFSTFRDLVLPFDADAAHHYADIVSGREAVGRPITTADAQIAAICATRGASLATRNVDDFESTGVHLVDPWSTVPQ